MEGRFTWSDAWLMQTLELASREGPARLHDILAVGDALNHAIFTLGELQSGFRKLMADGWVEQPEARCWALTSSAREQLRDSSTASLNSQRKAIDALLGAEPPTPGAALPDYDPDAEPLLVSEADYEQAWQDYRKLFTRRRTRRGVGRRR